MDAEIVSGPEQDPETCPNCDGAGWFEDDDGDDIPCPFCDGSGEMEAEE
jgi:DnaJ-class molecular chaperone